MKNICEKCAKLFEISDRDLEYYKKISVPSPKRCSDCRRQRRYAYRNEWGLYKRSCSKCGVDMIAMFPEGERIVYCDECWWRDDFDPREFGKDYDFNKSFFEQMDEMMKTVPMPRLVIGDCENSDYSNYAWRLKNCYLVVASDYCQDSMYSSYLIRSSDCVDCMYVKDSELMYQAIDCRNCYSCSFCIDCRNCQDCLGCIGLRRKQYCIFNEQYSKEEYEKYRSMLVDKYEVFERKFKELIDGFSLSRPVIEYCKNCEESFDLIECEDCHYCDYGVGAKDCIDCTGIPKSELCYESLAIPENYNLKFCCVTWPKSSFLEYCVLSRSSNNCFGCISLHKNEYCILNKQYSKNDYEKMIFKIKDQMGEEYGEFFPISVSPFKYTDTMAQDYYPIENDEICKKEFKIVEQEERFYKKMDLPIPKKSPIERHRERVSVIS